MPAFLTLAALLAGAGCGKGGSGGPTDPTPSDPIPSDPAPGPQGPAPVGDVMYAVDLANNFLVFGSGSITTLTAKMRITGLPILKRVIGIAIRPSDGALIGIGNDSRVYTIDPLTAEATPVSGSPFTPGIASFFDIHFAMVVEPNGERVRLVAAESGGNWSVSLSDGTAVLDQNARYADGTPLAGKTPRLLGVVYPTLPDSAKQPGWCANLAYGFDSDEAIMLASCDPATGEWWPTGVSPEASVSRASGAGRPQLSVSGSAPKAFEDLKDQLLRCGEFMNSPSGSNSEGEPQPPEGGPWFPRSPNTTFYVALNEIGQAQNRMGEVMPITAQDFGVNWIDNVPSESPIQSVLFAKGGLYGPSADSPYNLRQRLRQEVSLSAAESPAPGLTAPPAPPVDPRAHCGSAS